MGRGKKRIRIGLALILFLFVALLPQLAALGPCRDVVVAVALPKMRGRATVDSAALGWFSPVRCQNLQVVTADGDRAVWAGALEGDTPLWRLALQPGAFGGYRTQYARVDVLLDERGVNLTRLLVPQHEDERHANVSMRFELDKGVLALRTAKSQRPWEITPINLSVELQPANATPSNQRALLVRPGTLLKHAAVTPEMWAELLPYVLPMASDSTNVVGELSVELDQWRIPLDDPQSAEGSGRLIVHRLEMTPGPTFRKLASLLRLPSSISVAPESTVPFQMRDKRLVHRDLLFAFPTLYVRTNGSVGVDHTLDVVVDLIPTTSLGLENAPLGDARRLAIPIRGTLSKPDVDTGSVARSGVDLIHNTIDDFLRRHKRKEEAAAARPAEPEPQKPSLLDKIKGALKHD